MTRGGQSGPAAGFVPGRAGGFCSTAAPAPQSSSTSIPNSPRQARMPNAPPTPRTNAVKNAPESPIAAPVTPVASPLRPAYHF